MRIGTVLSIGVGVLTAGAAIALAVFSAICTNCGQVPTHPVAPPPTPGLTPSSTSPSPQATDATTTRLSHALLTRFGRARVAGPARTGTYGTVSGLPLPSGPVRKALSGQTPATPRGCGVFPAASWTHTAAPAPAATITLATGHHRLRETLLAPHARPVGLTLPARCRAFTLPGGVPARSAPLPLTGVGDAARGVVTLVGRRGAPDRSVLYTIVFRVGRVYGVVHLAGTGPAPGGAAVRKVAVVYAKRAAAGARGLL